jgi:hypothetical protein
VFSKASSNTSDETKSNYSSPTEPSRRQSERDDKFLAEALRRDAVPPLNLPGDELPPTPELRNLNSPWYVEKVASNVDYFSMGTPTTTEGINGNTTGTNMPTSKAKEKPGSTSGQVNHASHLPPQQQEGAEPSVLPRPLLVERPSASNSQRQTPRSREGSLSDVEGAVSSIYSQAYTDRYRKLPPKSFRETLVPYSGRLSNSSWIRVAVRPFILFAYPSILWSTLVYSLSVGWLIVLSESVAVIYRSPETYNFTALQTGLVYVSPFIGGILGTVVAGKISDIIVRWMARRNGGVYEPEFRLVMAIPIALATAIGLMGFGWSASEKDAWIVPTVFFGIISFGCTLGSTTAITFAVDSYRQYAGEALVTLNFSKSKSFNPLSLH